MATLYTTYILVITSVIILVIVSVIVAGQNLI